MTSNDTFRSMAMSVKGTVELAHFEKTSFRIGDKIFATLDEKKMMGCFRLSPADQQMFCLSNDAVFPVPGKWGMSGWTNADLKLADEALIAALTRAASLHLADNGKNNGRG